MAEGAFRDTVAKLGYADRFATIDSCGTGAYHTGEQPDGRTLDTLRRHGITLDHRARQVQKDDFSRFDYILAMDGENLRGLERVKPAGSKAQVLLFGHFDGKNRREFIEDPYYGGSATFATNFEQVVRFSKNFLTEVLEVEVGE